MFRKRVKKTRFVFTREEANMIVKAMVRLRNWAIRENIQTEDIDGINIKICR